MLILFLSALMATGSLSLLAFSLFAPVHWARFIEWEHALAIRLGVPRAFADWTKHHELGPLLKIVLAALTAVSIACVILSFHQ